MNDTAMTPQKSLTLLKRLRVLWMVLFVVQALLLIWALVDIANGERDTYHNQHARLVVQAILGMSLAFGFLVRPWSLKLLAALAVCAAIVASVWLMI